jgi:hypothetical protein
MVTLNHDIVSKYDLQLDPQGRLQVLDGSAVICEEASARRAFPWTNPNEHITIRDHDGKEIFHVDRLSELEDHDRRTLEGWLGRNTFVPRIQSVHHLNTTAAYMAWEVETDRGPTSFRVQEREDIRFLSDGRFTIRDTSGTLYELPPLEQLDEASRRTVQRVL